MLLLLVIIIVSVENTKFKAVGGLQFHPRNSGRS